MTIKLYKDCGVTTAAGILCNLGFEWDGNNKFEKDGKNYKFVKWDHFNSYVYSITLRKIA